MTSVIGRVVDYLTHEWKQHTTSNDDDNPPFAGEFLDPFKEEGGPFYGADEESFSITCSRSVGDLTLTLPEAGRCPWIVGTSTECADVSINCSGTGADALSWRLHVDHAELASARTELGPVSISGSLSSEKEIVGEIQVGPMATRVSISPLPPSTTSFTMDPAHGGNNATLSQRLHQGTITPTPSPRDGGRSCSSAASSLVANHRLITDFSVLFPSMKGSLLPHMRMGVRASNDPQEAPVVFGCRMWSPTDDNAAGSSWSLAALLSLTSLMQYSGGGGGLLGHYLSVNRGGGYHNNYNNSRGSSIASIDDELSVGFQKLCLGGALTTTMHAVVPIGPRVELTSLWNVMDGCVAATWRLTSPMGFPTVARLALHRSGVVHGGLELKLPHFESKIGVKLDDGRRATFGLELSC